jgi:hypothetical protein
MTGFILVESKMLIPDDLAERIASIAERLDLMATFEHTPPSLIQGEADILRRVAVELRKAKAEYPPSAKGGPTLADLDRPYCKPDQSCCDFCCGN